MKKLFLVLSCSAASLTCSAQFYINAYGSFNFPLAPQFIGANYEGSLTAGSYTETVVRGSFGKGICPGLTVGRLFPSGLQAEVSVNRLFGSDITLKTNVVTFGGNLTTDDNYRVNSLFIVPAIRYSVCNPKIKIHPYVRLGMVISAGTRMIEESTSVSTGATNSTTNRKTEYWGSTSIGMNGGIGVERRSAGSWAPFAEVVTQVLSWSPAKGEVVEWVENGVDQLPSKDVIEKQVEFTDTITQADNHDQNKPQKILKVYEPLHYIGIRIGVVRYF